MPTPNAPHRPKQPDFRRRPPRSYFVVLLALVVGPMAYAAGAAGVSHVRDAAVGDDTLRPTMPRRLRLVEATSTSLTLSWRPSNDKVGVAGYDVYVPSRPAIQTTQTTYRITSLACRTTYRVGVAAYDAAGSRSRVAWVSVSTTACAPTPPPPLPAPPPSPPPPPPADTQPPAKPILSLGPATQTTLELRWQAGTDNVGVHHYNVFRGKSATAGDQVKIAETTALSYVYTQLACGTSYSLALQAQDAAGNKSDLAAAIWYPVTTRSCDEPPSPPPPPPPADTQPPSMPSNLRITSSTATSIGLTWTASTDNVGVAGYDVYLNGVKVFMPSGTSFTYLGLSCATTYTAAVDAYDAAGNYSPKTAITVATPACPDTTPPSTPTGLAASSVTQTSLTLTWNASTDNVGTTGYDIFRNGTKTASGSSTSSGQTGLACGTLYGFGVEAYDASGNRSPRAQLNATTSACSAPQPLAPPPSPPPPPPPPAGCPYAQSYFCVDYSSQDYRVPWTTLFSYTAPGFVGLDPATGGSPPAGTPDGRVQVVPDPAGGPGFASRHEMRDSDPKWADLTPDVQKAEVRTTTPYTFNKPGVAIGDIRWFSFRIYLPYTATEKFEWASGGSNNFNTYMDIHPGASVPGALGIEWYGGGNPKYWTLRHDNGTTATSYNLFQLTDSSGARIMANHNRWIEWHLGVRFATDSSGWFEAWVDGVNVLPRTFGKTMSAGDTQQYLKQGLYKQRDAHYPSGVSVVYYGRTAISVARPF
jgi:chitodextrinase